MHQFGAKMLSGPFIWYVSHVVVRWTGLLLNTDWEDLGTCASITDVHLTLRAPLPFLHSIIYTTYDSAHIKDETKPNLGIARTIKRAGKPAASSAAKGTSALVEKTHTAHQHTQSKAQAKETSVSCYEDYH